MQHRPDFEPNHAGFTLVEALVALAVCSIMVAALADAFSFNLREAHRADDRLRLALSRDELLFNIRRRTELATGDLIGQTRGAEWRLSVNLVKAGSLYIDLRASKGALTFKGDAFHLVRGMP